MPNNSNTAFGLRRILLTVNILHLGGANRLTRNLRRSRHCHITGGCNRQSAYHNYAGDFETAGRGFGVRLSHFTTAA